MPPIHWFPDDRRARTLALTLVLILLLLLLFLASWVADAATAGTAHSLPQQAPTPRTITYSYDPAGRLVRADYGDGVAVSYTYDAAGNLLQYRLGAETRVYLPVLLRVLH